MVKIEDVVSKLNTGDLLLFHSNTIIGNCIQCFTKSKYSHIGMVLKDPIFIDEKLTGYYLWQSGYESFPDVETKEIFYGVQISPLEKVLKEYSLKNVYLRKLTISKPLDINLLIEIHQQVHHHKYDLDMIDWLEAEKYHLDEENDILPINTKSQSKKLLKQKKEFWCSSLIGYIYAKMEWLDLTTKWSLLSPEDWSSSNKFPIKLINCELSNDINLSLI
jgi:hypothetical protein